MRCDMETLINKIATNKLNKQVEVDFSILGNLPDCKRINTKDYIKVINASNTEVDTVLAYNKYNKPANMLECAATPNCVNTGALALGATTNYAVYRLPYNAVDFASGIITFYVTGFTGAKNVTLKISDTASFTNADVYTASVTGETGEFTPVLFDLSKTPSTTEGDGYTAVESGAYIAINVADAGASISSIAVFDSIDDFETNDVVKMGCLTEISGDDEIDAAEENCNKPTHDTTSLSFERTITGTKITENYFKLNPMVGKGEAATGYEIASKTFTVAAGTGDDAGYGVVEIADLYEEECGFVALSTECELLTRYDVPVLVNIDDDHFIVLGKKVYTNANLAGKEVTISYPREREITELVANVDYIDSTRVRMFVPYTLSNGKKRAKVYNNVLVTSFTDTVNEDDTEFSITVSIQKDASGHYYHIYEYE